MQLPAKRKPIRSGIERAPRREWSRHRRFVRSHECCVKGKNGHECLGPIQFAHVRTGTDGGGALKPSDWWAISLCTSAHVTQHNMGEPAFEKAYGIDMKRLALEFARKSTDEAMKAVMREMGLI